MKILLVVSAFNSLSQRVYAELSDRGHRVDVSLASHGAEAVRAAVRTARPELIIAPMLKTALPEDVWREHTCLIVHPGPPGDRGPSSLDWAIAEEASHWGVTVLRAEASMDAGDVWAAQSFPVPPVGKSDLYRNEVSDAASAAVLSAVERFAEGSVSRARESFLSHHEFCSYHFEPRYSRWAHNILHENVHPPASTHASDILQKPHMLYCCYLHCPLSK
jgi:putative two-component system hydrogenase maturation factor HypX/HoxX